MILDSLGESGFVSFRDLEARVAASPATIRRDLDRLEEAGVITRVRGGAKRVGAASGASASAEEGLSGIPFHENIGRNRAAKEAIGRAAAQLCIPGEGVMIDGGSTTLQMCPHLDGLALQVLTNSLHIVSALLPQPTTRILVPSGQVFREQNIVLSAAGDDGMPRFHAPKLFMGAASMGPAGLMQADVILVAAERRLIERADEIIVLVDSSKFSGPSGNVVCSLDEIDVVVTDSAIDPRHVAMMEAAGIRVVTA
ncbi:DeoR/GlpR family DNA-binding transcription regulator [Sphingopyxis sp.]|uniref:DeoR/GlpR family DNA-binding transcription regulator n=1 Tax=Sphingopyxis sp. TaxID=1908224 RepID=UPI002ED96D2E